MDRVPTYSVGTSDEVGAAAEVVAQPGREAGVGLALRAAAEGDVVEGEHDEPRADRDHLVDLGGEGGSVVGDVAVDARARARWRSRGASAPSAAKRSKPASSSAS